MPTPKSVVKFSKDGITYESNLDASQYALHELCRAALRDCGKFLARTFRETYYQHFNKRTGNAGKATKYKVISGPKTEHPRLQIGLKTGRVPGYYAYFQEFGTHNGGVPRLGLLTHAAEDNVATLIQIQSQYLSYLEGEAAALAAKINENDYDGDGDGDGAN